MNKHEADELLRSDASTLDDLPLFDPPGESPSRETPEELEARYLEDERQGLKECM